MVTSFISLLKLSKSLLFPLLSQYFNLYSDWNNLLKLLNRALLKTIQWLSKSGSLFANNRNQFLLWQSVFKMVLTYPQQPGTQCLVQFTPIQGKPGMMKYDLWGYIIKDFQCPSCSSWIPFSRESQLSCHEAIQAPWTALHGKEPRPLANSLQGM